MRLFKIFTNELRRLRKDSFLFGALLVMPLVLIGPALLSYSDEGGEEVEATPLMADENIGGIENDLGQISTEVKIAFPVSHNDLRIDAARRHKTTPLTIAQPPHNPQLD